MRTRHLIALVSVLALCASVSTQGLTSQQLMRLRHVTSVLPSPDGTRLIYTLARERRLDEGVGGSITEAFVLPVEGGEALKLRGTRGLAWRPGHDLVTWIEKGEGDAVAQIYGAASSGGLVQRLSSTPNGVGSYAWRPDGKAFAYTALDPEPPLRARAREQGFAQTIVDEDFQHVSLWSWDGETNAATRLTSGATVQGFAWAPDGARLAVAMSPRNLVDDSYMFTRLFVVDPSGPATTKLVDNPGKLGAFSWSPDGTRLAYLAAADRNDPHHGMAYVVAPGSDPVALGDGLRGEVLQLEWASDDALTALVDVGVRTYLATAKPVRGGLSLASATKLPFAAGEIASIGDGSSFAFAGSTAAHPPEVFVVARSGAPRRLTHSNVDLAQVPLGEQQVVRVTARDGLEFEGVRILPVGYQEGARYPMVIVAHGGPEAHYQDGWLSRYSEPGQVLAGMGYVVWYPNYRSSTGYGVEFAKADHGDPMGAEFRDHLDAIDRFVDAGLVDRTRVGVIGGSYGGYTAAWAATFGTEHFAAAVSFVPFVDLRTKWYTTDIPNEFWLVHYQERWPHEQPGFLADRSPLSYAARCATPLLICGGDSDPRVHPSQPFMLYRAVKTSTDTPCRYVRYPGEGHGNRNNVYRYDYLLRSVRWLDHYLAPGARSEAMPGMDLEYPDY